MYEISPELQQKLMALCAQVHQDAKCKLPDMQEIIRDVLTEKNIVFRSAVAHNTGGYRTSSISLFWLVKYW